ncbi:colipase like 1 [Homo sapiens]|uniref:Colipase-like protein 1 n=1 Tax=Homo sapiens TaxID=9606 RepID=COLL1_HUMAN|eukprot:NP_001010886.1 colipase-like protein 1 isoform 1 precursor [Homo sapiens]
MMLPQWLLLLFLLFFFLFLLTRGSLSPTKYNLLELKESCIRNQDCETGCCQRAPDNCESHCAEKGSEGSLCQTQVFFGQYRACPCLRNLTCIYSKNEKWLSIAYGRCQKIGRQKLAKKMFF